MFHFRVLIDLKISCRHSLHDLKQSERTPLDLNWCEQANALIEAHSDPSRLTVGGPSANPETIQLSFGICRLAS
jgi:hypothetical protein